jgi:transcriptional regulator with XRE-family HTH domain
MAQMLAPEVRSQFAQRLKTLRTQRGFDRARYFAKSLGIEENRYTRYERAEVEPSLTLIHKMCEALRVSPNELLGFADLGHLFSGGVSGLAEAAADELEREHVGKGANPAGSLAWNLAAEALAIRNLGTKSKGPADPLAALRETSALCRSLQAEPFDTVDAILNDAALKDVDAKHKARLAQLIQAYTDSVSDASARNVRS